MADTRELHKGYVQLSEAELSGDVPLDENYPKAVKDVLEKAISLHNAGLWCVLGNVINSDAVHVDRENPRANILPYNARTKIDRYNRDGIEVFAGPDATNGKNTLCIYIGNSHGIWIPQKP